MFKRVLVPLDGSMLAESALEPAMRLAQQANGTVYLMRVPVYVDSGAQTSSEYQRAWVSESDFPEHEDVASYLREMRDSTARPGVSVRTIVGEGERSMAILNTAVAKDIDLIVMASHARKGISRLLLGSVSGDLIRRMSLMRRMGIIRKDHPHVMLIRQPSNINHILITLDGSELAERVIEPALALATGFGSRVTFLQVKNSDEDTTAIKDVNGTAVGGAPYLDGVLSTYAPEGLQIDKIVRRGSVTDNILSCAAENEVDLIAMSTRGHSGLRKLIFGSRTEKVMCDSGCAMLITHPPDLEMS